MGMRRLREKMQNDKTYKLKHRMQSKKGMRFLRERKKQNNGKSIVKNPYASRQTFGKAMKQVVCSLPTSPHKKRAVLLELAIREAIIIPKKKVNVSFSALSMETRHLVENFYRRDDILRQLPGIKDVISVKNVATGNNTKIQKRLLMLNLREAWTIYTEDHPEN